MRFWKDKFTSPAGFSRGLSFPLPCGCSKGMSPIAAPSFVDDGLGERLRFLDSASYEAEC